MAEPDDILHVIEDSGHKPQTETGRRWKVAIIDDDAAVHDGTRFALGDQQLHRMVETRRGLEIIIDAASTLYDFKSMQRLAEGVLTQIASLLNVDCAGILILRDSERAPDGYSVLAGSGCYSRFIGAPAPR